jgi:hypothetical protein
MLQDLTDEGAQCLVVVDDEKRAAGLGSAQSHLRTPPFSRLR